jgi:hypothetical protein
MEQLDVRGAQQAPSEAAPDQQKRGRLRWLVAAVIALVVGIVAVLFAQHGRIPARDWASRTNNVSLVSWTAVRPGLCMEAEVSASMSYDVDLHGTVAIRHMQVVKPSVSVSTRTSCAASAPLVDVRRLAVDMVWSKHNSGTPTWSMGQRDYESISSSPATSYNSGTAISWPQTVRLGKHGSWCADVRTSGVVYVGSDAQSFETAVATTCITHDEAAQA